MKNRISEITSESISRNLWMGTFHSIFARILRSEAQLIGYQQILQYMTHMTQRN